MNVTNLPTTTYPSSFSKKRMNLRPTLPIPINYATAAVPTFAPFGTEYTPDHTIRIVGGRRISIPSSVASFLKPASDSSKEKGDPDISPTKSIQNIHAYDYSRWQQPPKPKFDTTYRTEYINRTRHPDQIAKPIRNSSGQLNQYSILPPINVNTKNDDARTEISAHSVRTNISSFQSKRNQDVPPYEKASSEMLPVNLNNTAERTITPSISAPQQKSAMTNPDAYLPREPILLTNFEEERLAEQIRQQIGNLSVVEKLKLFYQELMAYDPNGTKYVHCSNIQNIAYQIGINLREDTFRFAMCKFVSPDQMQGYVNYEDMIRYFGKCLSSIIPNQYDPQRSSSPRKTIHDKQNSARMKFNRSVLDDDDMETFDPDERQVRVLLRQNLKYFDVNGSIDFDKLYRELQNADHDQSGILNRQQIEEVVYKVRIPLQRSLLYQILEKHCRVHQKLYKWEAFIQYLKEQVLDIKEVLDRSSPVYTQHAPTRNQWLDRIRREYYEKNRLQIIEQYISHNEGPRLENNSPSAWFTRYLRLANAMYSHRTSSNREQEFVLPREEARRLFRAYNHVWNLKIDEIKLQRILDACARNSNTSIDEALKLLAK